MDPEPEVLEPEVLWYRPERSLRRRLYLVIYRFVWRLYWKFSPAQNYRRVKWFIQRGTRGYAECDVWGLDTYISEVLSKSLRDLAESKTGVPGLWLGEACNDDDIGQYAETWPPIKGELVRMVCAR
jgi:hypothetical protein